MLDKANLGYENIWRGDLLVFKKEDYSQVTLEVVSIKDGDKYLLTNTWWHQEEIEKMFIRVLRQDQLQALLQAEGRWAGYYDLLQVFAEFVYHNVQNTLADDTFAKGNSYEMLWLMFTMKEISNKVWNSKTKGWEEHTTENKRGKYAV